MATPASQEIFDRSEPSLTAGSCLLSQPDVTLIVQDALLYFEGQRHHLGAWCIMPNHIHVIVQPIANHKISDILHSWKSFTSAKINRHLHREGKLWERESFNHLIRSNADIERFSSYIEYNPVAAGLVANPKEYPFSSCGGGVQPAGLEFIEPRQQPFVEPRTRGELTHLHKECGIYFITWRLLDAVILNNR